MPKLNWRYALGELLIVIVGISIAFSLNNWWQQRQDRKLEQVYLRNLADDLEADIRQLDSNTAALHAYQQIWRQSLAPHLGNSRPGKDTIQQDFFKLVNLVTFLPKDVTYQTLVNSGDYTLIRDFELRKAIEEHYIGYRELEMAYARQQKIHETYLADFFIDAMNFQAILQGDYSYMAEDRLRNIMSSLYGTHKIQREKSEEWAAKCRELVDMIRVELGEEVPE